MAAGVVGGKCGGWSGTKRAEIAAVVDGLGDRDFQRHADLERLTPAEEGNIGVVNQAPALWVAIVVAG